eukprot:TRINITY_DN2931_c0_g1_i2.p1 TRINITY_DN2931_c0_g1~~TRINITY_DN2931_c0_g1_i2.p1  ORF type:complete len:125 (-),score=13.82 TRINITY_DN2931_c0_g1_i2:3742-4116(-)
MRQKSRALGFQLGIPTLKFSMLLSNLEKPNKICQINTMDGKLTEDCPEIVADGIKYLKTQGCLTAPEHLPPSETSLLMSKSASKILISVKKKIKAAVFDACPDKGGCHSSSQGFLGSSRSNQNH